MKTLFYGGSFNPIGNHHLIVMQMAMEKGGFQRGVLIPCYDAPHKEGLLPFEHRWDMCRIAVSHHGSNIEVSAVEKELYHSTGRKSYTIETVRRLKEMGEKEIHLLIGTDSLWDMAGWYKAEELLTEASFVVAPRKNFDLMVNCMSLDSLAKRAKVVVKPDDLPVIDVSSTLIRERRRNGLSIVYFVPRGVAEYISQNKLYLSDSPP